MHIIARLALYQKVYLRQPSYLFHHVLAQAMLVVPSRFSEMIQFQGFLVETHTNFYFTAQRGSASGCTARRAFMFLCLENDGGERLSNSTS